jgi:hypothetical protein
MFDPLKPPDGWRVACREYILDRLVTVGLVSDAGVLATFYRIGAERWYCPTIQFCDGAILELKENIY